MPFLSFKLTCYRELSFVRRFLGGVNLDMCLSVNIKLINTHPRVPVPYLWDRPSRKKSDLVFMGGLSQRTKIALCRCQKFEISERK